jgi:hypothetical protein
MEVAAMHAAAYRCLEPILAMGNNSRTTGYIPDWAFFALVLVPLLLLLIVRARREKDAKKAYCDSLERLKRDPANRALQAKTVKLAKRYVASARGPRGSGDADEIAIIEDLFFALNPANASEALRASSQGIEPKANAKSSDGSAPHVIAGVAKQSATRRMGIASSQGSSP